jgi:ABC-2 type transport system ATP-binding protein
VRSSKPLPSSLPGVISIEKANHHFVLHFDKTTNSQAILRSLIEQNIPVDQFEIALPTLDEIFIKVVQSTGAAE